MDMITKGEEKDDRGCPKCKSAMKSGMYACKVLC